MKSNAIETTGLLGQIRGEISSPSHTSGKSIVVVLIRMDPRTFVPLSITDYNILEKPGEYTFYAMPDSYWVLAFEDENSDYEFQYSENVGWYPDILKAEAREEYADIDFRLRREEQAKMELPELYTGEPVDLELDYDYENYAYGEITTLDDTRFSDANGRMGMWDPNRFSKETKTGIYFLEPYGPNKIPVLFIHGALGHPGKWKAIVPTPWTRKNTSFGSCTIHLFFVWICCLKLSVDL